MMLKVISSKLGYLQDLTIAENVPEPASKVSGKLACGRSSLGDIGGAIPWDPHLATEPNRRKTCMSLGREALQALLLLSLSL